MAAIPEKNNEYEVCPYNPLHKIRKSRLPMHLNKCAKQHPNIKLVTCQFNSTHRYDESKAQEHLDTCPDRKNMSEVRAVQKLPAGLLPIPAEPTAVVQTTSYWDEQITMGSTLKSVLENAKDNSVYLTHNISGSKAEKRDRKINERIRFSQAKPTTSTSELEAVCRMPKR